MQDQRMRSSATGTVVRGDLQVTPFQDAQEEYEDRDLQLGQFFKTYLEGYEGYHPSNVMEQIRTDPQVLNQLTEALYEENIGPNEETYLQQNNTTREATMARGRQQILNDITQVSYSGEEISQTIGRTLREMRSEQGLSPILSADREIKKRKHIFADLLDERGELIMNQQALTETLNSDDELYNQVVNARLETFNEQLQKKHNAGVLDPSMATQYPEE